VVIRLAFGNCSTARVVDTLLAHQAALNEVIGRGHVGLIELT